MRIARGGEKIITSKKNKKIGEGDLLIEPKDYLFITTGVMAQRAIEASRQINSEENKTVGVLHMPTVKPLDKEILLNWIPKVTQD